MPSGSRESVQTDDVTALLRRWDENRDEEALNEALPHIFDELRHLARGYLKREDQGHTLQPTELVHEAYLRLLESRVGKIRSRSQVFAFAARLMRQILVDHARGRNTAKRGGDLVRTELRDALETPAEAGLGPDQLLALHIALERLAKIDFSQCQIAELRYFVGLTVAEIAEVLEVSVSTVERRWEAARRWLAREMSRGAP